MLVEPPIKFGEHILRLLLHLKFNLTLNSIKIIVRNSII